MKIADCDIEMVFDEDECEEGTFRYHTLQFVCAPRGRRKKLVVVEEEFHGDQLEHVDIDLSGPKTRKERAKLVSGLLRGSFRPKTQFDPLTIKMLETSYLKGVENFYVRFAKMI